MEKMQFKVEDHIQLNNLLDVLSSLGHRYHPSFIDDYWYPLYIQTWSDMGLTANQDEWEPTEWTLVDTDKYIISAGRVNAAIEKYGDQEDEPVVFKADNLTITNGGIVGSTTREELWSDKHYDFNHTTTNGDVVKVDPYFVANQWKLGQKDNSGVLFHILKTIARFGDKNPREREIKAIHAQIKRLAELEGIEL